MLPIIDSPAAGYRLFPSPETMVAELPLPAGAAQSIDRSRAAARAVLDGTDDRLLVVTGPCSVHDPAAALDYAGRLAGTGLAGDLMIIMRVYTEKPRTVSGWPGLLSDPGMDGACDIHRGLRATRRLLLDIISGGIPVACEWLNPAVPVYLADLPAWAAIGARTTESQVHRYMASGLPMPVGFKNGTDGDVQVAVNACLSARHGHTFLGITPRGLVGVVTSTGNADCHVVLRGGRAGPNYEPPYISQALEMIEAAGLPRRVLVDASHGNSGNDHHRQAAVARMVAEQAAAGEQAIVGVMLESFLVAGRQDPDHPSRLVYGQSVTDACMDFDTTVGVLADLAAAVRRRRASSSRQGSGR